MTAFDYARSPDPIRPDLVETHRRVWERIARPGTWWSGVERVGLAAEARAARECALCWARAAALSPAAVEGEHDAVSALPPAAIEVVHRLVTDAGRLTRRWFEETTAEGLSDGHYVEIVGVAVSVVSIDAFHRALGLPLEPLPEPRPGEPSRYRPPSLRDDGAYVAMIPPMAARGDEADLWPRGQTANVIRALSLVPDEVRNLKDLSAAHYLTTDQIIDPDAGRPALARPQIELIAGRVSAINECFY